MNQAKNFFLIFLLASSLSQISCSINDIEKKLNPEIDQFDSKENNSDNSIDLDMKTVVTLIDSIYAQMNVLDKDSDVESHCEWLKEYSNKIQSGLYNYYEGIENKIEILNYTKKSDNEYVLYSNEKCQTLFNDKISEKVKLKLNGVFACSNPNDPNLIKPHKFRNNISKFQPDFKETPSYVEIWYNQK